MMEEDIATKSQTFESLPNTENIESENDLEDKANKSNENKVAEDEALDTSKIEEQLKLLKEWVTEKREYQNLVTCFPYYLLACYPQLFIRKVKKTANNIAASSHSSEGSVNHGGANNANDTYEYAIAPFWKRVTAEVIDVLLLLVIKIMITFSIVHAFELDTAFVTGIKTSFEESSRLEDIPAFDLLSLTPQFIVIEFITKLLVCIYEAIWTMKSRWNNRGATPGKMIMGLQIVYSEETISFYSDRINLRALTAQTVVRLQQPAETPGFTRALLRAVLKNVLISFLLPTCFVMFCFSDSRLTYDAIAKTFVVVKSRTIFSRRQ